MSRVPTLFNTVHRIIDGHGIDDNVVDQLCTEVGDLLNEAVADAVREHVGEGASTPARPQRLGMTENQAAMRWCPMVREVIETNNKKTHGIGNRYLGNDGGDYTNPAGARCIGGMCLCWRWDSERRGHCGLAGLVAYQPPGEPRRIPNRTPLPRPDENLAKDLELIVDTE
jgi:hypothetical protein